MYMGLQVHCHSFMVSIQFLGYVMTFVTVGIVILTAVILLWIITPDICELHTDESQCYIVQFCANDISLHITVNH